MTPGPHVILAPGVVRASITLEPAFNILSTMQLLASREVEQVLSQWIKDHVQTMDADQRRQHQLAMNLVYYHTNLLVDEVDPGQFEFQAYLESLTESDPETLRDQIVQGLRQTRLRHLPPDKTPDPPSAEIILTDIDAYLTYIQHLYDDRRFFDEEFQRDVHYHLTDPESMQALIVNNLQAIWEEAVEADWERVEPMLQGVLDAFSGVDLTGLTIFEAVQTVTGRDLSSILRLDLSTIEELILIPSAHTGPYVIPYIGQRRMMMVFGARMPEGVRVNLPDVSRSELLVRLNALADDTRLRILELFTTHDELCAQEIITRLDLSQSAASRHLRQLSATGYLNERRQEGAKCYTLNPKRVDDTLAALSSFLARRT